MGRSFLHIIKPYVRKALHSLRPSRDIEINSVEDAFTVHNRWTIHPEASVDTPELAKIDLVPGLARHEKSSYTAPSVEAVELRDVLFCPVNHVILSKDFEVAAESICTIPQRAYLDEHALHVRRVKRLAGTYTTFRSRWYHHHYHTLIDHLPRLYTLDKLVREKSVFLNHTPKILVAEGLTALERLFFDRFTSPANELAVLNTRALYEVERFILLLPLTRRDIAFLPAPYPRWFRKQMDLGAARDRTERVYISRKGAGSRRVTNEPELIEALRAYDFKDYQLENFTPKQQMSLFNHAEFVVSPHGAGLANLLFSSDASVIECFASHQMVPNYYFLSKAMGHTYYPLFGSEEWREDDFEVDLDALCGLLNEMNA